MASTIPSYVPIRDDSGIVSLSQNERNFTQQCAMGSSSSSGVVRTDGRTVNQIRNPIQLQLHRGDNVAIATVQWGTSTRCSCTVSAELVRPSNLDRPAEGTIGIQVDISPSANTSYRQTMPSSTTVSTTNTGGGGTSDKHQKLMTNQILRYLERMIIQGGVLDYEALCVEVSQWVWKLSVAVTILDSGGNIVDAAIMSCMAALRHYRKPIVQISTTTTNETAATKTNQQQRRDTDSSKSSSSSSTPIILSPNVKQPTPLPLQHTPLAISFALISSADVQQPLIQHHQQQNTNTNTTNNNIVVALIDPNAREELCSTGTVTIGMNVHGEICLYEFSGGVELPPSQLRELYTAAYQQVPNLFASFEESLMKGDEQDLQDRLYKLQSMQNTTTTSSLSLPPLPESSLNGVPFFQSANSERGDDFMIVDNDNNNRTETAAIVAQNEAEEAYRRQALDYNLGHIATRIRDDDDANKKNKNAKKNNTSIKNSSTAGTLLAAMLKSISSSSEAAATKLLTANAESQEGETKNSTIKDDLQQQTIQENDERKAKTMENERMVKKNIPTGRKMIESDDDDEEDVTMELTSEFVIVSASHTASSADAPDNPKPIAVAETKPITMSVDVNNDDDEVDDLAAAIKKKKKGSKKSKK